VSSTRSLDKMFLLFAIALLSTLSNADAKVVDWTTQFGNNGDKDIEVKVGDTVTFNWNGNHNVYAMQNKAAYDSCDFSGAVNKGANSGVTESFGGEGVFYYACKVGSHCQAKQKIMITVAAPTDPANDAPTNPPALEATTVEGYVVDNTCWGMCASSVATDKCAGDKSNVLFNPENHTVKCSLAQGCQDSGFVMLKKGTGAKYEIAHVFDAASNAAYITWLEKQNEDDAKLYMVATGKKMAGSNVLVGASFKLGTVPTMSPDSVASMSMIFVFIFAAFLY